MAQQPRRRSGHAVWVIILLSVLMIVIAASLMLPHGSTSPSLIQASPNAYPVSTLPTQVGE